MRNGTIGNIDYISFGSGAKALVMLPGLGDSLRSIQSTTLPMSVAYHIFAREYTVYVFGRRHDLPEGSTTRDMARDLNRALEELEIYKADVMGISMGGMIAQWLAIDFPEMVRKLVLVVTTSKPHAVLTEALTEWMDCARRNDHEAFMESNLRRIYTEEYCEKYRWLVPFMGKVTQPKSYDRFLVQAHACFEHNSAEFLGRITVPTLVIGGEQDKSISADESRYLAQNIPGAKLHMYENLGHGLYDEARDFQRRVFKFLTEKEPEEENETE